MRPAKGALKFVAGGLYPGYALDGPEMERIQSWLEEFRFWQAKVGSPYVPYFGYRFDTVSYSQEPSRGWEFFDSAYVRVPRATLDAKLERFRVAGWKVRTVDAFAEWEEKTRRKVDGVEHAVLPWCKGESNRGRNEAGRQKRCAPQSPILDPSKIVSHLISHCLAATKSLGLTGVSLSCKRAFYSANEQGTPKLVFGPGADESPVGGPLLAPPLEAGTWDATWIQLARALRDEGLAVVKEERPRGYPDATGATWLPADLRAHVTEEGGPERL